MKNVPANLSNLKSKVGKSDFDKLITVLVDLSEQSDVVKMTLLKKMYIIFQFIIMLRSKILKI